MSATEELLSAEQRRMIRIVVVALMHQLDVHATATERITPPPTRDEVNAVLRILMLPAVGYRRGTPAEVVIRRIITTLGKARFGEDYEPPADID